MTTGECQCPTWPNETTKGRCVLVCGNEINAKWVKCRPCAFGNHTGKPCDAPRRDWLFPIERDCANCGFDLAVHKTSTNGEPN